MHVKKKSPPGVLANLLQVHVLGQRLLQHALQLAVHVLQLAVVAALYQLHHLSQTQLGLLHVLALSPSSH